MQKNYNKKPCIEFSVFTNIPLLITVTRHSDNPKRLFFAKRRKNFLKKFIFAGKNRSEKTRIQIENPNIHFSLFIIHQSFSPVPCDRRSAYTPYIACAVIFCSFFTHARKFLLTNETVLAYNIHSQGFKIIARFKEEGKLCSELTSPRRSTERRSTASAREWLPRTAERFSQDADPRAERDSHTN